MAGKLDDLEVGQTTNEEQGLNVLSTQALSIQPKVSDDLFQFLSENGNGRLELRHEVAPGIATLCINHPEKKNAFCGRMILDFQEILSELETSTAKCLIVYGVGGSFSSGADLRLVKETFASRAWSVTINDLMRYCLTRLIRLPMVTVAALSGPVIGGGAELSTACDFRLATSSVKIQFVHARLGISTAWGGGTRLTQLMGPSVALRMLAGSQMLDAQTALQSGFVSDAGLSEETLVEEAVAWLQRHFHGVPEAVKAMKKVVVGACYYDSATALAVERGEVNQLWGTPIHRTCVEQRQKL